jgi:NAD-dependent aldehyde dehydrogenases
MLGSYIDAKPVIREDTPRIKVLNPIDARDEDAIFSTASLDDVRSAIDSAYEAFDRWPSTPPHQRGRILFKAAEIIEQSLNEFSRLLTMEEGKTLRESRAEVERAIGILRFYAGLAPRIGG